VAEVLTILIFSVHFFFAGVFGLQLGDNKMIRQEYGKRVKKNSFKGSCLHVIALT
jgi:hypothetical protein